MSECTRRRGLGRLGHLALTLALSLAMAATVPTGRSIAAAAALRSSAGQAHDLGGALAFTFFDQQGGGSGLFLADERGVVRTLLTDPNATYMDVEWTGAGQLVFSEGVAGQGGADLYRIEPDGTDRRLVAEGSEGQPILDVTVSPDGSNAAFSLQTAAPGEPGRTYVVPLDGGDEHELTAVAALEPRGVTCSYASRWSVPLGWSPDGTRLLVAVIADGCEERWNDVVIVDVEADRVVDGGATAASDAAWSPDGDWIAYAAEDAGLVVATATAQVDGRDAGAGRLGYGEAPAWSPDGALAFTTTTVSTDGDAYEVWVSPDPTAPDATAAPLTSTRARAAEPRWSPDGRHIAFTTATLYDTAVRVAALDDGDSFELHGSATGTATDVAYAPSGTAPPADSGFRRLGGATRVETAARLSRATFPEGTAHAFVARSDAFPDALVASYPAGILFAPVLLTPTDELHPAVRDELMRLSAAQVTVFGDTSVVSSRVEEEIELLGIEVDRIAGADRYATSRAANALVAGAQQGPAFVVTGTGFPDALAVGPLAARLHRPIVLTTPEELHPEARATFIERGYRQAIVVGGTSAVAAEVEAQLEELCFPQDDRDGTASGSCVEVVGRIGGRDRTETAALLADELATALEGAPTHVVLARGDEFADAAAAGPLGGALGAPILLTASREALGVSARTWLARHADTLRVVDVLGTGNAVAPAVVEDAVAAATPR